MAKDSRNKLLRPYIPEFVRLAEKIKWDATHLESHIDAYYAEPEDHPDPVPVIGGYEDLYQDAVALLLTVRAAIAAAGFGTKQLP